MRDMIYGGQNKRARAFMEDVRDHIAAVLSEELHVDGGCAADVADKIVLYIAERYGGGSLYIQKPDIIRRRERDRAIWREFTGANHFELARKYNVSTNHVYRLVRSMRAVERSRRMV